MKVYSVDLQLKDRILCGIEFTNSDDIDNFIKLSYRMRNYLGYRVTCKSGTTVTLYAQTQNFQAHL